MAGYERGEISLVARHVDLGVRGHVARTACGKRQLARGGVDGRQLQARHGIIKGHRSAAQSGKSGIDDEREAAGEGIIEPEVGKDRGDSATRAQHRVVRRPPLRRDPRPPPAQVMPIRRLRIDQYNLPGSSFPNGYRLATRIHRYRTSMYGRCLRESGCSLRNAGHK